MSNKDIHESHDVSQNPADQPNHQRTISAENPTISHYGLSGHMRDQKSTQENPPTFGNQSHMDDKSATTQTQSVIQDTTVVKDTDISAHTSPGMMGDFSKKIY